MASTSSRRIIVTGCTGFIGRAVTQRLIRSGADVLPLTTNPSLVRDLWDLKGLDTRALPDDQLSEGIREFQPTALMHLAWSGLPDYSTSECLASVEFSMRAVRLALEGGATRLIGAGSCWEYGSQNGCLSESLPTDHSSPFTQAKARVRSILETAAKDSERGWVWARIFYAYGPGQRDVSLVPSSVRSWRRGVAPDLRDPTQALDFIHVADVADGLVALLDEAGPSGVFNIGSGSATQVSDVSGLVRDYLAGGDDIRNPGAKCDGRATWADTTKMLRYYGWKSQLSLTDGLRSLVADDDPT